jgi:hypothetical protein
MWPERLAQAVPKDGPAYAYLRSAADRRSPRPTRARRTTSIFGNDKPTVTPNQKLAGNQLNNFAAFLSARWRQND